MLCCTSFEWDKEKAPQKRGCYVDGLVSTGNKFPYTILKRIFSFQKNFFIYFINIYFLTLWKRVVTSNNHHEISGTGFNRTDS